MTSLTPGAGSLFVAWSLPIGAFGGHAQYAEHGTGQWTACANAWKSQVITGLDSTKAYDVRVVFTNGTVSTTATATPRNGAPINLVPPSVR